VVDESVVLTTELLTTMPPPGPGGMGIQIRPAPRVLYAHASAPLMPKQPGWAELGVNTRGTSQDRGIWCDLAAPPQQIMSSVEAMGDHQVDALTIGVSMRLRYDSLSRLADNFTHRFLRNVMDD